MSKVKKIVVLALVFRLVIAFGAKYHPDIRNHLDWGQKLWQYGPRDFYESIFWGVSWPNQPPGSMYLFGLVSKVDELIFNGLTFLNQEIRAFPSFFMPFFEKKLSHILFKIPFVLAEVGLGWLVYRIILSLSQDKRKSLIGGCLIWFNPALIFNSAVWGQTDALINLFALAGIWLTWNKNYLWGLMAFIGSLYLKLSLIIWLPVIGLILLRDRGYVKKGLSLLLSLLFYILISLPFVHHGNVFTWLWYMYTNRVLPRQGNMLSGNAFNFWTLVFGVDLGLKEAVSFLGTTARRFGRFISGLLIMILSGFGLIKEIKTKPSFSFYLLNLILLSMTAFLFLTNMHERYLYPIFAPSAILAGLGIISFKLFAGITVIHWLNLYNLWWYPNIPLLRPIMEWNNFLLARLMSLGLLIVYLIFFRKYMVVKNEK
jgi:hypothetical protein